MKVRTMSAPRLKCWLLLASLLVTISAARPVQAQIPVGNIEVCYSRDNCFFEGTLDGPIFLFHNTSATDITSGVFKIGPGGGFTDSFNVGTIAAGTTVGVVPGVSDDGGTGHTFFAFVCPYPGCIRDTSEVEVGPNGNNTQFRFTGQQGSKPVDSGVFTPAPTQGPSLDGTVSNINFLGGPGNNDGPCNSCFDKIVANLNIPSISVVLPLQPGVTTFQYPGITQDVIHLVDYSKSGLPPSAFDGLFMQSTIQAITYKGWGNQLQSLLLGTPFFRKNCLLQKTDNTTASCLVTTDACGPSGGPYHGILCPTPMQAPQFFIDFEQTFFTDVLPVIGCDYIAGADDAMTCAHRSPPDCRALVRILFSCSDEKVIIHGHKITNDIFLPLKQ
jgi:hypothetical protein